MAVAVSRDLAVQVLEDVNAVKLTDRQQALRAAIQRGEPKCLGVSQVMLGLMVMSYSIPLHFTEVTEVVSLGVPWWSGLMFITVGVVAIILDKHCTMRTLQVCLMVSVVSTVLSMVAVIIYSVDMDKHPEVPCVKTPHGSCSAKHYAMAEQRSEVVPPPLHSGPDSCLCHPLLPALQTAKQLQTVHFSQSSCSIHPRSTHPP
ncbi:uncharacterized protein LOC111230459 isoform X2 [Seriola dumerili]|uniref:uncharacterized protein LOC111230459 isoform X2 n=1 Tax=Seriola dumerili TaxID=41447 RepID=UPI000BBE2562|nr:uncharacterized protein LOC111230459 isoform X2 [Seriola dumerili]